MSIKISFNIQKGGCGKSTFTHETAAQLHSMGYKVLCIDLDQQRNLSFSSGAIIEGYYSVYEVLKGACKSEDAIQQTANYDIMIASNLLAGADVEFSMQVSKEYLLKDALEDIEKDYDFILIDTPPSLGVLPINALVASNYVIIPVELSSYSLQGIGDLYKTIQAVKRRPNPELKILGLVINKHNKIANVDKQLQVMTEETAKSIGTNIFSSTIRVGAAVRTAQGTCSSLIQLGRSAILTDFKCFTLELLLRLDMLSQQDYIMELYKLGRASYENSMDLYKMGKINIKNLIVYNSKLLDKKDIDVDEYKNLFMICLREEDTKKKNDFLKKCYNEKLIDKTLYTEIKEEL